MEFGIHAFVWTEGREQAELEAAMESAKAAGFSLLEFPGKEFNGVLLGENGRTDFTMSADCFVFPVNKNPEQTKAQKLMAKVMIDPAVQIAFNAKKGSEPARLDVDISKLDAIAQYGMRALQKPDQRIPATDFLDTPDFIGAERDLAAHFWANKSMTVDQFVNGFVKIVETEKANRK